MAMKFVALDIALAFHHLFIGKPPGEKRLVFSAENRHQFMFTEEEW